MDGVRFKFYLCEEQVKISMEQIVNKCQVIILVTVAIIIFKEQRKGRKSGSSNSLPGVSAPGILGPSGSWFPASVLPADL